MEWEAFGKADIKQGNAMNAGIANTTLKKEKCIGVHLVALMTDSKTHRLLCCDYASAVTGF
jgi:hypothetical protein